MPAEMPPWLAAASERAGQAVANTLGASVEVSAGERVLVAIAALAGGFMPDSLAREIMPLGGGCTPGQMVDATWKRLETLGIAARRPALECRQIVSPATLEALGLPPGWSRAERRREMWTWFLLADFVMHYGERPGERPAPLWLVGAAAKREALLADAGGEERMPGTDPELARMPFEEGWPVGCRTTPAGRGEWVFGLLGHGTRDRDPVTSWLDRHASLLRGLQESGLRVELRWITAGAGADRECESAERWRGEEMQGGRERGQAAGGAEERTGGYRSPARLFDRLLPPLIDVRRRVLRGTSRAIARWQPNYRLLGEREAPEAPAPGAPGLLAYHKAIADTVGEEHWEALKRRADAAIGRGDERAALHFRFVPWVSDRARQLAGTAR